MSRSGYTDDCDGWGLICWRGAVKKAIKGKRGQAFLREMLAAMDALPKQRLIDWDLERDGEYCAIGTVGHQRGIDMSKLDPEDNDGIACEFGIARALVCEIEWINDEDVGYRKEETPEQRFQRVRNWIVENLEA